MQLSCICCTCSHFVLVASTTVPHSLCMNNLLTMLPRNVVLYTARTLGRLFNGRSLSTFNRTVAITRNIDDTLKTAALTMNTSNLATIDLALARKQHEHLNETLRSLKLEIHELPSDGFADSVFIEDTAVVIGNTAMITKPGARSRQGEVNRVRQYLKEKFGDKLKVVDLPGGTVDGGDVLFTGKEILVGLTTRTNMLGIHSMQKVFPDFPVRAVDLAALVATANKSGKHEEALHLKSVCSMCGDDSILVGGGIGMALADWLYSTCKGMYKVIHVPDTAAANCVYVNGTIVRRSNKEFPASELVFRTKMSPKLKQIQIEAAELAKVDGALTCCSLLIA